MPSPASRAPMNPRSLGLAWLALVGLTLASAALGDWLEPGAAVQVLVAAILWLKGWLVARRFLEAPAMPAFLRRVLAGFIAFSPAIIVLTALFPGWLLRITTL